MILGIMCATENELNPLVKKLENHSVENYIFREYHTGTLEGVNVVAVIGGVGKVNGAITAQSLIEKWKIDKLIFTGVAGGLDERLKVGDIVVGTRLVCHDIGMGFINNNNYEGMCMDGFFSDPELVGICKGNYDNVYFGTVITGDQFITGEQRDDLIARFDAMCVDMESAAVAQVCWFYKTPLLIIRSLSDCADDEAMDTYEDNLEVSSIAALGLLSKIITKIN